MLIPRIIVLHKEESAKAPPHLILMLPCGLLLVVTKTLSQKVVPSKGDSSRSVENLHSLLLIGKVEPDVKLLVLQLVRSIRHLKTLDAQLMGWVEVQGHKLPC